MDDLDTLFERFRAGGGAQFPCRSSSSSARVRGAAGPWRGIGSQLLAVLDQEAVAGDRRRPDWPRALSQFSGVLGRIAPSLRAFGIPIEFTRDGHQGRRLIELRLEAHGGE